MESGVSEHGPLRTFFYDLRNFYSVDSGHGWVDMGGFEDIFVVHYLILQCLLDLGILKVCAADDDIGGRVMEQSGQPTFYQYTIYLTGLVGDIFFEFS